MYPEKTTCLYCGCSREFDSCGDRVCFCDTCKETGCSVKVRTSDMNRDEIKCFSKTHSHYYYFDTATGENSWENASVRRAQAAAIKQQTDSFIAKSTPLLEAMGEQELLGKIQQRQSTPTQLLAASVLEALLISRLSADSDLQQHASLIAFTEMAVTFMEIKPAAVSFRMMGFLKSVQVFCHYPNSLPHRVKTVLKLVLESSGVLSVEKKPRYEEFRYVHPDWLQQEKKNPIQMDASAIEISPHTVIVLLGEPLVGKSHLGMQMLAAHKIHSFADIGKRLLGRGEIDRYNNIPTNSRFDSMFEEAKTLLKESVDEYMQSDGSLPMMVTFVKETCHAYALLDLVQKSAQENSVARFCVQAFYLVGNENTPSAALYSSHDSVLNKRRQKWQVHNASVLEVFSADGGLVHAFSPEPKQGKISQSADWYYAKTFPRITRLPLVVDSALRAGLSLDLKQLLGVDELAVRTPASLACMPRQLSWLGDPGRYLVSRKLRGVRYLLVVDASRQVWLVNRAGSIYRVNDLVLDHGQAFDDVPAGAVLDGILEDDRGRSLCRFVAFDILCCGPGDRVWQLPYSERLQKLRYAISPGLMTISACRPVTAVATAVGRDESTSSPSLRVHLTIIHSMEVSFANAAEEQEGIDKAMRKLSAQVTAEDDNKDFQCDGLIFTPTALSYIFGADPLMFSWQSKQDIAVSIVGSIKVELTKLDALSRELVSITSTRPRSAFYSSSQSNDSLQCDSFVFNCVPELKNGSVRWIARSLCLDTPPRSHLNPSMFDIAKKLMSLTKDAPAKVGSIVFGGVRLAEKEVEDDAAARLSRFVDPNNVLDKKTEHSKTQYREEAKEAVATPPVHPSRLYAFESLAAEVDRLVGLGVVERYVHESTHLEVLSYTARNPAHHGAQRAKPEDMCRGLILHRPSQTVVATPFVRFFKPSLSDIAERGKRVVRASPKYDGSLVIAFKWEGELHASTRRRMDSEQALWATRCLRESARACSELKPGWTYLLELVGGNNLHIVSYTISQSLVLLTAFDDRGVEVSAQERSAIAVRVGLPVAPALYAPLEDIADLIKGKQSAILFNPSVAAAAAATKKLGGNKKLKYEHEPDVSYFSEGKEELYSLFLESPAPLLWEGWVVEDQTDGVRFKLVDGSWDAASTAVKRTVHPAGAWTALRSNRVKQLLHSPSLPLHARAELSKMVDCIAERAEAVVVSYIASEAYPSLLSSLEPDLLSSLEPDWARAQALGGRPDTTAGSEDRYSSFSSYSSSNPSTLFDEWPEVAFSAMSLAGHRPCLLEAARRHDVCLAVNALAYVDHVSEREAATGAAETTDSEFEVQTLAVLDAAGNTGPLGLKATTSKDDAIARFVILHKARPGPDGAMATVKLPLPLSLSPYVPSPWLSQTFAKGWAKPDAMRHFKELMSWDENTDGSAANHVFAGCEGLAHMVFEYLGGLSNNGYEFGDSSMVCEVPRLREVCRLWNRTVNRFFKKDMFEWQKQMNQLAVDRKRRLASLSYSARDFGGGFGGGFGRGGSDGGYDYGNGGPYYDEYY